MKEYNGVTPNNGSFKVQIGRKGKVFYLGNFPTEVQAAQAYDRAILISSPWSDRKFALNFDESVKPAEDKWTKQEQAMVTHLRSFYPSAETDEKQRKSVEAETPDVLLDDVQEFRRRQADSDARRDKLIASMEKAILRMAGQLSELKQMKQFSDDKLVEAEATIVRLRGIKHEDGKPKFKLTPVVPRKVSPAEFEAEQAKHRAEGEARLAAYKAPVVLAVPETPASPVPTVFVETAPMTHEPVLAPAIEALRQIVLEPAEEGQAVQSSGVMEAAEIESVSSESEKEDDPEPIYPVVPGAKNPPQNGDEESGENAGFSKE